MQPAHNAFVVALQDWHPHPVPWHSTLNDLKEVDASVDRVPGVRVAALFTVGGAVADRDDVPCNSRLTGFGDLFQLQGDCRQPGSQVPAARQCALRDRSDAGRIGTCVRISFERFG